MWRKNRVGTNTNGCMGIDLNRNWNYDWNSTNSNENSCSENYRGPAPNSELEIKSIIQFIEKNLIKMKVSSIFFTCSIVNIFFSQSCH